MKSIYTQSSSSNEELLKRALWSASYIELSPHEWTWTQTEQEEMAKAILLLNKKIDIEKRVEILERRMEAHNAQDRADNVLARVHKLEDLHD